MKEKMQPKTWRKDNTKKEKEVYTDGSKNPGKKEASIHTAEMIAIKVALKEIKGRRGDNWVIYTDGYTMDGQQKKI